MFEELTGDCSLDKLTHKTGHSLRALCIFLIPETDILEDSPEKLAQAFGFVLFVATIHNKL